MAGRKSQENDKQNAPSTVKHESSASNAKDIGADKTLDTKKEMRNASTHRRGHGGSDGGADQERGSNH